MCVDRSIAEDQEEFHRKWIVLFADRKQGPAASEWALAWFALDNTMHRACHVSADALALRRSQANQGEIDLQIQAWVDPLLEAHRKWRQRKVVREADEMERNGQLLSTFTESSYKTLNFSIDVSTIIPTNQPATPDGIPVQFLDYPQVQITNSFFSNLLNQFRSIEIYISLIPRPIWGTPDHQRFECAVDICRTHSALGAEKDCLTTGKIWGLYLSGVTFGGEFLYPVHTILRRFELISRGNRNG